LLTRYPIEEPRGLGRPPGDLYGMAHGPSLAHLASTETERDHAVVVLRPRPPRRKITNYGFEYYAMPQLHYIDNAASLFRA
jgi:hypothetical protein